MCGNITLLDTLKVGYSTSLAMNTDIIPNDAHPFKVLNLVCCYTPGTQLLTFLTYSYLFSFYSWVVPTVDHDLILGEGNIYWYADVACENILTWCIKHAYRWPHNLIAIGLVVQLEQRSLQKSWQNIISDLVVPITCSYMPMFLWFLQASVTCFRFEYTHKIPQT